MFLTSSHRRLTLSFMGAMVFQIGMLTGLDFSGSRTGEFREIACTPSLQNSVATVRKSTDAAQRRVIKVPFRSQYRPVFANWCDLAVGRPISIQLCSLLWTPTSEDHLTPPLRNVLWSNDPLAIRLLCPHPHQWPHHVQTSKVTGDICVPMHACRGHTSGVDHPPRARGWSTQSTPRHTPGWPQSNYIDDHRWCELLHSESIDRSSPERVPGNLLPSWEI